MVNLVWTLTLTLVLAALVSISSLLPFFNRMNKSVSTNGIVKGEGPFLVTEVAKHQERVRFVDYPEYQGGVYNVTLFVEDHPGGDAILNNAGADSTEGSYGSQNRTKVFEMLDDFYVSKLVQ